MNCEKTQFFLNTLYMRACMVEEEIDNNIIEVMLDGKGC